MMPEESHICIRLSIAKEKSENLVTSFQIISRNMTLIFFQQMFMEFYAKGIRSSSRAKVKRKREAIIYMLLHHC